MTDFELGMVKAFIINKATMSDKNCDFNVGKLTSLLMKIPFNYSSL